MTDTPLEHALALATYGLRVLPIKPGAKYPPMRAWQNAATTDIDVINNWWGNLYSDHGVGLAMGEQPDGRRLFALDVDEHDPNASGSDTLDELEQAHRQLPDTVRSITGSAGAHLIFDSGDVTVTNGAAGQVGPGLDIRGEGGQIVVAPTIHPNGTAYTWEAGFAPWEHKIAAAPAWLMALVRPPPVATVGNTPTNMSHAADTPADILRKTWNWPNELQARGWVLESTDRNGDTHWTRPGKDPRDGASAVLHAPDGPFVVFTTDASARAMWAAGKVAGDGSCVSLSPLAFYAASDHNGNISAASGTLRAAQPQPDLADLIAPTTEPQPPVTATDVAQHGAAFILDESADLEARWGVASDVLWACGESLIIAAPPGVGKTTLASQLVSGLIGTQVEVLGFPVKPAGRVLYLAMDRPRQIRRVLRRIFTEEHRQALTERLVVRPGPLAADLGKVPELLAQIAHAHNCDVVILDSLKDAAIDLSKDEIGGNVNRAIQHCNAAGIDVLVLHHQRKGTGGDKPTKLEDVYGNTWITAGAGSVFLLWGEAGSELVEMTHLKQPADPLGPWTIEHDHHTGISAISHGFDALAFLRLQGNVGCTVDQAAQAEHGSPQKPGAANWKKTERRLRSLVKGGLARLDGQRKVGQPARYYAVGAVDMSSLVVPTPVDTHRGHDPLSTGVDTAVDTAVDTRGQIYETPGHTVDTAVDANSSVPPWTLRGGSISPRRSKDQPSQPREKLL